MVPELRGERVQANPVPALESHARGEEILVALSEGGGLNPEN